jgi:hypothetical protein
MNETNYAPLPRRTRESIQNSLLTGNPDEIHDALLSAAYWEDDWRWAQQQLLSFADCENDKILWAVALGLGYIAAFHGEIDEEMVRPVLARLKKRAAIVAVVEETEEEIEHFVRRRKAGENISLGERLPEGWRPPGQG